MIMHVGGRQCRVRGCLWPFTGGGTGLVVRVFNKATWQDGVDVKAIITLQSDHKLPSR